MTTHFCRVRRVVLLAAIGWSWAAGATSAQMPNPSSNTSSLAAVKARVPVGNDVYVTHTTGATMKGTPAEVTDDAVRLYLDGRIRSVAAADLRRIQWHQPIRRSLAC